MQPQTKRQIIKVPITNQILVLYEPRLALSASKHIPHTFPSLTPLTQYQSSKGRGGRPAWRLRRSLGIFFRMYNTSLLRGACYMYASILLQNGGHSSPGLTFWRFARLHFLFSHGRFSVWIQSGLSKMPSFSSSQGNCILGFPSLFQPWKMSCLGARSFSLSPRLSHTLYFSGSATIYSEMPRCSSGIFTSRL